MYEYPSLVQSDPSVSMTTATSSKSLDSSSPVGHAGAPSSSSLGRVGSEKVVVSELLWKGFVCVDARGAQTILTHLASHEKRVLDGSWALVERDDSDDVLVFREDGDEDNIYAWRLTSSRTRCGSARPRARCT